jgi:nicotinamidase-related amidase
MGDRSAAHRDPTAPRFDSVALLTVGAQVDHLGERPLGVPGAAEAVWNAGRICRAFRRSHRPVVHVLRLYRADGSNAEPARRGLVTATPVLRPGTPGRSLVPPVVPPGAPDLDDEALLAGDVQTLSTAEAAVAARTWGGFAGTPLDDHLRDAGVTTVVVSGTDFPHAVRPTVYEAVTRHYRVVVAADAVARMCEHAVSELVGIGVRVQPSHEVVARVAAAAHP